ncbi:MAG: S8 family serine peptidase [Candidatus Muirbacterium halophilum]|nr:S8 family serine peptidase [Candidatus Muirbacterium halophilum]
MKNLIILSIFICSIISFSESMIVVNNGGTRVLVVDSGTDFAHPEFNGKILYELAELNGVAGKDDDNNGYIDDLAGWNFVENTNVQVDTTILPPFYDEVLRYNDVLEKYGRKGEITQEDYNFAIEFQKDLTKRMWMGFIGGYAHGTHVAGIISKNNNHTSFKAIKFIGTGTPPSTSSLREMIIARNGFLKRQTRQKTYGEIEAIYKQLGDSAIASMQPITDYVAFCNPRVINCSYGDNRDAIFPNVKKHMLDVFGYTNPDTDEVFKVMDIYAKNVSIRRTDKMYEKATNALLLIAAGNSAEDVDKYISSPIDMSTQNKIVIAATFDDKLIADFSCYGIKKVDIAAPGVLIKSSYPSGKYGLMSGTSQATPYVSKIAAKLFHIRPALTPVEVKKILMGTADKKDWLKEKVVCGGVVNPLRAEAAARLVNKGVDIDKAIAQVLINIGNAKIPERKIDLNDPLMQNFYRSTIVY